MSLGKSLRAAARHGLRCYQGDWGELLDDPFAAPGKKARFGFSPLVDINLLLLLVGEFQGLVVVMQVSLVFKPDVFSRLSLHKNNPYGIKTTLHVLDL